MRLKSLTSSFIVLSAVVSFILIMMLTRNSKYNIAITTRKSQENLRTALSSATPSHMTENSTRDLAPNWYSPATDDKNECPDILAGMARGRWLTRPLTDFEQTSMDIYLQTERSVFNIPPTFQRDDGQCGENITYEKTPQFSHMWFKSICNPKGDTPCCKAGRCVALPEEECRCPTCFDERQVVYPEFATWQPSDERCQPHSFSVSEACQLLDGATIHVVGDSFVREVYIALAILLTGNHVDGALKDDLDKELRYKCLGLYQVTGANCRYALNEDRKLCGGRVRIKYTEIWKAHTFEIFEGAINELIQTPKSFVVMGLGIHDNFKTEVVHDKFFSPLFDLYANLRKQVEGRATKNELEGHEEHQGRIDNIEAFDKLTIAGSEKSSTQINKNNASYNDGNVNNRPSKTHIHSYVNAKRNKKHTSSDNIIEKENTLLNKRFLNHTRSNHTINTLKATIHDLDNNAISAKENTNSSTLEGHYVGHLNARQGKQLPHLFWMGIHAPGLLKSPHFSQQTADGVQQYNAFVAGVLENHKIPVLDTFNFTSGVVSFDGTHYGWAINMLKANMMLTYIQEVLVPTGEWS